MVCLYAAYKQFVIPIMKSSISQMTPLFCLYSKMMTLTIVTAKLKAPPSGLSRHTGGVVKIAAAHHGGRVSESESSDYKISSSSDDSLLTYEGKFPLKPYIHELPATPSTLRKSVEKKKDHRRTRTLPVCCLRVRRLFSLSFANQIVLMGTLPGQQSC